MNELLASVGLHSPALFALAVLILNATPGVDVLCITSRTLAGGARAGVATALGISLGCVVQALLAAFGLAALLATVSWAFELLKWMGAAYLLWLAWGMLRAAARPAAVGPGEVTAGVPGRGDLAAAFRQGLLTNLLNPKVALFYLAFLPQFILPAAAHKTQAFLLLAGWFAMQSLLFLLVLVALLVKLRRLGRSPRLTRAVQALGGVLFVGLALRMVQARVNPV